MRFAYRFTVDRHAFQARDDKAHTLSLRGASGARDTAIHRDSGNSYEKCGLFAGSQWIATGYAFAMTKDIKGSSNPTKNKNGQSGAPLSFPLEKQRVFWHFERFNP